MFRRQLLRQSRTISESVTAVSRVRQSPFHSATFISPRPATSPYLSSRLGRRWQSTESENNSGEQPAASTQETKPVDAKEDPVKQELEKYKKEVVDLKDKYLRAVADYRNLQDRTKREMESARQFALQRFATDLLDSVDNLDRALSSVPQSAPGESAGAGESNKDLVNLISGLKMTEEILMNTLKKHGLERYDPLEGGGRKFDPNTDEATFFTKVEGKEDGEIFFTQSKGYKLNGRILRAAKVGVVKNS
ncbi:molecular chaperone GrpE [Capronia epimyces CBS 606.96]|uniref:GrpE protein homolog, mitochondrial n=1 Tax=Capronia epimyces CBS 606.96 TaxID=1182542 RepID=W9XZ25_9EURO|nr:molecular chaperone GrpE [Capronia epimyces CBS 606.96]EXJ82630.1 molecular chaperone GrpE [Capronia epimyces CBS 606.96]